ncbi:2-dehydropantoate 2-reductase [Novosphingobium soli]|uniref:2-dehydropantoate 2-reductase n=1 Tax=Novosphingobium soli TaxID=574956 RepID=A0ABV6CYI8_9SPHN
MTNTVAIIGTGAVGATIGAWLTADQALQVTLCARTPFERLRVETPAGVLESTPRLLLEPEAAAPVDWVIVATKTYDAGGASRWLDRLLGPCTRLAVLQNGVEHLARFPEVEPASVVPVIVDIPAERTAPGQVVQRRTGSLTMPAGANGEAFARLFAHTPIETSLTDDWLTAAWRKLAVNCAGAVSALTLKPAGIVADQEVAALMRAMVLECVAVGRAQGARLDDGLADEVVEGYRQGPPDSINSILADRLAGRATEADARNGVIARLGRRHAIPAPLNHMADVLLRAS